MWVFFSVFKTFICCGKQHAEYRSLRENKKCMEMPNAYLLADSLS